jgi:hypothetical protein
VWYIKDEKISKALFNILHDEKVLKAIISTGDAKNFLELAFYSISKEANKHSGHLVQMRELTILFSAWKDYPKIENTTDGSSEIAKVFIEKMESHLSRHQIWLDETIKKAQGTNQNNSKVNFDVSWVVLYLAEERLKLLNFVNTSSPKNNIAVKMLNNTNLALKVSLIPLLTKPDAEFLVRERKVEQYLLLNESEILQQIRLRVEAA